VWTLLRAERALLRSPGLVVVSLSRKVEEDFRRAYPEIDLRFQRIYHGVDLGEFHDWDRAKQAAALRSRYGIPPGDRVALFVGHKFGPKGLAEGVRAVAAVPRLHLLVLGKGRPERFARLAESLGAADRVHFAGAAADPRPFYAGAEVLLHPTWYDPCSLAVLEALASGLPVVTTRANGAGELLEDGREGFVVEPGDVAAMTKALEEVLGAWDRFHSAALARVGDLSFDRHLEKMLEVLGQAASERRVREGREGAPIPAGR
jgi:UDP-glucose:(heptosyl)LPS alpha-1,3-glucosyltransferase